MFEVENDNPVSNFLYELSKTSFDIIRNSLITATLGYFYEKSHSPILFFAYTLASCLLGIYVGSIFMRFTFKKSFFSDSTGGHIFRILISGLIFLLVSTGINIGSSYVIKGAISAQANQGQTNP